MKESKNNLKDYKTGAYYILIANIYVKLGGYG